MLTRQTQYFCVKYVPGLTRKAFLIKTKEQQKELAHLTVAHSPGATSNKAEGPDLNHTEGEGEAGLTPPCMSTCRVVVPLDSGTL